MKINDDLTDFVEFSNPLGVNLFRYKYDELCRERKRTNGA